MSNLTNHTDQAAISDQVDFKTCSSNDAIGKIRLAISDAISLAARNAVNQQEQFAITIQAATTEAITRILSMESAGAEAVTSGRLAENSSTVATAGGQSIDGIKSEVWASVHHLALPSDLVNDEEFSQAFDKLLASFSQALSAIAQVQLSTANSLVKQTLSTAVILKMLAAPENFDAYSKILDKVAAL